MKLHSMVPFRFSSGALVLSLVSRTLAISQQYCSSQNTGSDYSAVYSIYQSNGACFDTCKASYAFAIVQYQDCWCSNYIPAAQQNVSSCNENCPGYPDDKCGNAAKGLYGYIPLSIQPSGTAGATSSTSAVSSSIATSSSSQPTTSQSSSDTYTQPSSSEQSSDSTSYSSPSTSSATSTSTPTSTSTSTTSSSYSPTSVPTSSTAPAAGMIAATTQGRTTSQPPTPVTSVRVVTVSGAIVTETVTSTPVPAGGDNMSGDFTAQRKGLSGGAIAGIVIGTLLGLAALLAFAFALWRRRKVNDDAEGAGPRSPRRTTSVLSRTGLLSRGRPPSMAERADAEDPLYGNTITGSNSVRHSMLFGAGAAFEGVAPESPLGSSHDVGRYNRPLVYDQRLNPSALFAYREANGSRVSMQDQQDYSRPLGIVNPDPARPSFESRISHA